MGIYYYFSDNNQYVWTAAANEIDNLDPFCFAASNSTKNETHFPTAQPTDLPSWDPTVIPTAQPTDLPSWDPTVSPTAEPTDSTSRDPVALSMIPATAKPNTSLPSTNPTVFPAAQPTDLPSRNPT